MVRFYSSWLKSVNWSTWTHHLFSAAQVSQWPAQRGGQSTAAGPDTTPEQLPWCTRSEKKLPWFSGCVWDPDGGQASFWWDKHNSCSHESMCHLSPKQHKICCCLSVLPLCTICVFSGSGRHRGSCVSAGWWLLSAATGGKVDTHILSHTHTHTSVWPVRAERKFPVPVTWLWCHCLTETGGGA